jgi:uncharacterized protein with beta-barrel porin domain
MVGGISLRRQDGALLLSATADFGYGDYDTTRTITVGATPGSATGSLGEFDAGAHLRASYQLPFDRFYLQPSLDLAAIYVGTGSYTKVASRPSHFHSTRRTTGSRPLCLHWRLEAVST